MNVKRDLLLLFGIVSAFLAIGGVLMATRSLPEDYARDFHPLSAGNMTIDSGISVIREPSPGDDTYIYAINDAAEGALYIALNDTRIQKILDQTQDKAITIAAIQPTLLVTSSGEPVYSSGGQVIITANWQLVGNRAYSDAADFSSLQGEQAESHQQVWNILVNMDRQQVTSISESKRAVEKTLEQNLVYAGMNMFLPDTVRVDAGTTIRWFNESNVPHNVVGAYKTESGSKAVDSGFVEHDRSWQYGFDKKGVFEYRCTIHTQDGMKGTIIVS
jgi:plastocyanin